MADADRANLVEIFSSFQGEGPHVGERTLFVRFGECDLRCSWCDSPNTWRPARQCRIEKRAGEGGSFELVDNPVAQDRVLEAAEALGGASEHRFASLTGGEPLLQPGAVRTLAEALRARGFPIHLETHGLAPSALEAVVDVVDVVSMDWKFESDVERAPRSAIPEVPFAQTHERFAQIAATAPSLVVKCVVTQRTERAEFEAALSAVERVAPQAVVVLQPVTPPSDRREHEPPPTEQLQRWQREGLRRIRDVRLIPQTHPALGAL